MILNLGCGAQVYDKWTNVDYALGARLAKLPLFRTVNARLKLFRADWDERIVLHDLTKPFPWADNSADGIYTSHTLEHLAREDGRRFLRECHRVLRPGGLIRVLVPDLRLHVMAYLDGKVRADDFVERLDVLYDDYGDRGLKRKLAPFVQFPHKCMYDTECLVGVLQDIGFDASPRAPFDSGIPDVREVELEDRTRGAVIVEGVKH
ncbi:methyltransferase domain-containing protein [Aquabacterium sp. A7-Y]|uniref:class I SAM-dependent methyltransferase n=1 Tax=Aquabacterium sp. A7-Y TaxID=1349605 RepID=UPI00223D2E58|nr:methyltransferase domain-containing protein [Aquabacterium sp. A7-Y]MCW7538174.1 methyltransferase domain-containing protein [Aquabacterium sp. A7-Y]